MENPLKKIGIGNEPLGDPQLQALVNRARLPRHVAIIMDGNGRWAEMRGLPRIAGHREGIRSVRDAVTVCRELGIYALTIYAFSVENWQRPQDEVNELMTLLEGYLQKEMASLMEHRIRFKTIGQIHRLPASVAHWIRAAESATLSNEKMVLTIALSYGGRAEIVEAMLRLYDDLQKGLFTREAVDEALVGQYLNTADLPDPDLMIRTSGETRISNFLLWQMAYTELYFTPTLWPDFRRRDFLEALIDYQQRERRFGLVKNQNPPRRGVRQG
ncbi:MAG TPA: isoprenyl transferase [Nitrospiria bacterium]|nr:isoprenyl transferase [Nitrospiria bacterium]